MNTNEGIALPHRRLRAVGERAWEAADEEIAAIGSREDLKAYQERVRGRFAKVMGPLPDPAAPVAFTAGRAFSYEGITVHQMDVRSEKGYEITGWTYRRSDLGGLLPGLVVAAGHAELASLHEPYATLCLYAARCGFFVFGFDPPGQGSRREVFLPDDHPVYWDPCKQHQHLGAAATLAGIALAHFFVSDCMTAVSFVCQQPQVDPERVGFAGQSGGGLQTFFAMGADPRIRAAVPSQATSTRRGALIDRANRDMEQTYLAAWQERIDLPEMALLFAPRPVRIISEYGYPDQGKLYRLVQPVYERIGAPEGIELASAGTEHALSRSCREMVLSWLTRHLSPPAPEAIEPEWPGLDHLLGELRGQVEGKNARGRGIVAWCQQHVREARKRERDPIRAIRSSSYLRGSVHGDAFPVGIARGIQVTPAAPGEYRCLLAPDYPVPFTLSEGSGEGLAVVVDEAGAGSDWARQVSDRASREFGHVIALDTWGCGSLRSNVGPQGDYMKRTWEFYGPDNFHAQDAFMAGTCPVALAAQEVCAVLNSLGAGREKDLYLTGRGWPAISLLVMSCHLDSVRGCYLSRLPESFEAMLAAGRLAFRYTCVVPGLLPEADIPEILRERKEVRYVLSAPLSFDGAADRPEELPNVLRRGTESAATLEEGLAFLRPGEH